MKKITTRQLVLAGLFTALGVLLPYVTGHAFGLPGTTFLPMHIPVMLAGFFCGPVLGALCGLVIPVLSSLLTGMPPIYPMLPIMAVELIGYGLISGLLYRQTRLPLYPSMIAAMLSGRVLYGVMFSVLMAFADTPLKALPVWGAVVNGLPGIAIQLVLVPLIVRIFDGKKKTRKSNESALEEALSLISSKQYSCIVISKGKIIHKADGRGVKPLLWLYDNDRAKFKDALVVDKIIGKAAAMILVAGGARAAYGVVMSQSAKDYLDAKGVSANFGRCVDVISSRDGNGICPIEKSVLSLDDPAEGIPAIRERIAILMANKPVQVSEQNPCETPCDCEKKAN